MRSGVEADLLRHYERVSKFRGTGISEVRAKGEPVKDPIPPAKSPPAKKDSPNS